MTNEEEIRKEWREKFNYASFTWNGDNATGVSFAKKNMAKVEKFWIAKLKAQDKIAREEIVDKVMLDVIYACAEYTNMHQDPSNENVAVNTVAISCLKNN